MAGSGLVRRLVGVGGLLAVLLAALLAPLASPASAEPDYPPKFNKITASTFVVQRHGTVRFTAQYFKPGSTVRYKVVAHGRVVFRGVSVADAKGVVHQSIRFNVVGKNTVSFSGTSFKGKPLTLSAKITVLPLHSSGGGQTGGSSGGGDPGAESGTSGSSGGFLPHTGAQIAGALLLAAVLVGGGVLLVAVSRRRRHS